MNLQTQSQSPDFLTPPELAMREGVPIGTLEQWRYLKKGPAFFKFGRHVRYLLADVESWEAMQRTECNGAA